MAITSFYLLNMFPQMRTYSSSPNNHHPTPRQNMFPRMRTLHHRLTINTQQPSQTCSLGCALYIITQQSTPITQAKHVPSDAHFTSSPNNQHPTPKPKHVPSDAHFIIITQQSTPITQAKHVPSDAHFTSSANSQHPSPNSHERNSIDFSIKLAC